ncbi:MAG: DUF4397 domain-containing protein [Bacteroidota bacterium]|nr:DUF4397 domain-containing protein [Bacteroidota bacterium]
MKNNAFAISTFALFLPLMLIFNSINAQNAQMQVIYNSADLAAQTVDIYVNGKLFIDDFQFRTATEFKTVQQERN